MHIHYSDHFGAVVVASVWLQSLLCSCGWFHVVSVTSVLLQLVLCGYGYFHVVAFTVVVGSV